MADGKQRKSYHEVGSLVTLRDDKTLFYLMQQEEQNKEIS